MIPIQDCPMRPTPDDPREHNHWTEHEEDGLKYLLCSVCGGAVILGYAESLLRWEPAPGCRPFTF